MYSGVDALQITGVNRKHTRFWSINDSFQGAFESLKFTIIITQNIRSFDTPDVYLCKYILLLMARSLVVQ